MVHAAVVIGCLVAVVCVRVYSKHFVSHRIFHGIHFVIYCKENNHHKINSVGGMCVLQILLNICSLAMFSL